MNQKKLWKIESLWDQKTDPDFSYTFDFSESTEYVFSDDYGEYKGLKFPVQMIEKNGKNIYLFDNHNMMLEVLFTEYSKKQSPLHIVHIDAHNDDALFPVEKPTSFTYEDLQYLISTTRISDFFDALSETKVIHSISRITTSSSFKEYEDRNYDVLSLDIDIFGEEGEFIDLEAKVEVIKKAWKSSQVIAIAMSPGFINQSYAKEIIQIMIR